MAKLKKNRKTVITDDNWRSHRNFFLGAMGVSLIAVLLSANFLFNYSDDHARVLRVNGAAFIQRGKEKISPLPGTVLNAKDKIITGKNAYIEVTYDDTHRDVLRIGSDSNVVLESAFIEKETTIFMDRGEILIKLEKLERGSTFKIRTPVAIAGVRGTSFGVRLTGANKEAVVTDFESRVFVKGLTEDFLEMKEELLLSDGWKAKVAQFEKPVRVEKINAEEHSAWLSWLKETDSLRKPIASDNRISIHMFMRVWTGEFAKMMLARHVTSSVSILALLLYAALTFNLGRIFLWQKNLKLKNTLSNCGT